MKLPLKQFRHEIIIKPRFRPAVLTSKERLGFPRDHELGGEVHLVENLENEFPDFRAIVLRMKVNQTLLY